MNPEQMRATLTIALMAAFADGLKDERERAAVKRVADALGPEAGFDLPGLYREVLLAKPDLAKVAAVLQSPQSRQLAYEMAVGVCDADGAQGPAEREFLQKLVAALGLDRATASAASDAAEAVAEAAFGPEPAVDTGGTGAASPVSVTRPAVCGLGPSAGPIAISAQRDIRRYGCTRILTSW
jgi:tellurite resistance protein